MSEQVRGQNKAHRRGLVLGLTMAEIMVLIIFTLLLALTASLATQEGRVRSANERVDELSAIEALMAALLKNNPEGLLVEDIIQQLSRQQDQITELTDQIAAMMPQWEIGGAIDDIVQVIERENPGAEVTPEQIIAKIADMQKALNDNDNLRGQVAQLTAQVQTEGRGNEYPSCWVTPDGRIESIFQLLITADGIEIRDRDMPHRVDEKAGLPLTALQFSTELTVDQFQASLQPLYNWSVQQNCRFYVIIYSSVSSAPIQMVNAVNMLFYPDSTIQFRPDGL